MIILINQATSEWYLIVPIISPETIQRAWGIGANVTKWERNSFFEVLN